MTTMTSGIGRALAVVMAALGTSACATGGDATTQSVPQNLRPAAQASLVMVAAARGVQVYECRAGAGAAGVYAWQLVAPEADLFDARGERIGRHFAGPQWEAGDGSRIEGSVTARSEAPAGNAIPWLLLAAKSVGGEGVLSRVTSVQRINTSGGVPPGDGCTQAASGTTTRVPYAADYYFWSAPTNVSAATMY